MKLRPYQVECVEAVESYWSGNPTKNCGVSLPTGAGKGHPLDTEVPTPSGIRRWGDLEVGDMIYGRDHRPTEVTAIYDRGVLPTYRITHKDGSTLLVDGDHLIPVQDYSRRRTSREFRNIEARELVGADLQDSRGNYIYRVVPVEPDYSEPDAPLGDLIAPYALGALLAEGGLGWSGVQFTSPDVDYVEKVRRYITLNKIKNTTDVCDSYSAPGLSDQLRSLGLKVKGIDKFIPERYFHLSARQRLDLLRGLMDGDGSQRRGGRSSARFSTSAPQLAEGMVRLATSLGGTAFVSCRDRGRGHAPEYVVQVRLPAGVPVFSIERHMGKGTPRRHFSTRRPIVKIERVEDQPIRCITVAAEDHLYLITRSNIVTHNTVIMSAIASRAVDRGERVAIIVDRDELVSQTVEKLRAADPLMFIGVVKASRDEVAAEVVVCSIQTLRRPGRAERILPRDVVIYDEAHGSAAESAVGVMDRLGTIGGPTRAVGFSATFYRADGKPLDVVWDDIVYERSILWAVSQGYLSDARGISVPIRGLDLDQVRTSGGDYQDRDLAQKMLDASGAEQIADAYVELARGRTTICFAPTVASAEAISAALVARGVASETVTGSTAAGARAEMYARLASGETEVLCSVAVLTTGFDSPRVDCVLMARPTKSQGLYVQCIGRGLRLYPGKDHCLILDVSGSAEDHSLIGLPSLAGKQKSERAESLSEMAGDAPEQGPRGLRANLRERGEFDPLARKRFDWLKTPGRGIEFVAVKGNSLVFLEPAGGDAFRIGKIADRLTPSGGRDGKWLQEAPVPREFAAPLAEAFVAEFGVHATKAERRRMKESPSVAQVGFASMLGIEGAGQMTRGELSSAIDVAKAASVLD